MSMEALKLPRMLLIAEVSKYLDNGSYVNLFSTDKKFYKETFNARIHRMLDSMNGYDCPTCSEKIDLGKKKFEELARSNDSALLSKIQKKLNEILLDRRSAPADKIIDALRFLGITENEVPLAYHGGPSICEVD